VTACEIRIVAMQQMNYCSATRTHRSVFQALFRRIGVKNISLIIAAAAAISMTGAAAGFAAELPTYEANGLPISTVQVGLLGASHVREQSAVATIAASPHQLSVLTPRAKQTTETASRTTTGQATR
jgi:hypothetical protein